jgi:uncharacterized protein YfaS (alpha-2-macroglobulin family)
MQVHAALSAIGSASGITTASRAYLIKLVDKAFATLAAQAALPVARRAAKDQLVGDVAMAAAALSALDAAGDMAARAQVLHAHATALEAYPVDAAARLLAIVAKLDRAKAMRAALLVRLASAAHETAAAANIATAYVTAERLLLPSSPKSTALALDALLREAPDHALVPKLARGILDARLRGRWATTQENTVVLAALRRYFDVYEKVTPAYTGKVWVGTAAYAEQAFAGRSGARGQAQLGWTALRPGTTHDLAVAREGAGRMYYRLGITYAPQRTDLPALDAGFVVRRTYTAVDNAGDVVRAADGTWRVKLGAKVLVTVEAIASSARHGVAVVDPLPAGFEAIDERLAVAERAAKAARTRQPWEHVSLRDNRSEAFAMDLPAGAHTFIYSVRATTPGTYRAAPAKAEEMYSPETFGRSTGEVVVVE